jgi:predicted Zn-dependent protease
MRRSERVDPWSRWGRRLGAAALALALASCGTFDQTRQANVPVPPPAPRTEINSTRVPPQVARTFGGVYIAPELERRLSNILARLAPVSERPDLRFSVTILNSPVVNAFALPDGQLFVTRGLLALANDDAEVAGVIAHEMGHVVARHASQRVEQAQNALLGSRVLAAVTGDRQASQTALAMGAITLASFSRQQELEADILGIRNAHRAGFDAYGAARLLESMDRYAALRASLPNARSDPSAQGGFLATHPSTPERLALAVTAARQLAGPDVGQRERDGYLRVVDGLIYGDDPRSGLVRGRTYLHPGFGFSFTAPDGFVLENTARAVIGVAPDGRALRFDTIAVSPLTALTEALAQSATADLAIDAVTQTEIAGAPAATALGRSPGWTFRFVLIRLGNEVYRFIFAARGLTEDQDAEFLQAARSFRRLTSDEVASIRPYRVRTITVGAGDTIDSLAARMGGESHRLERFLVMNGIDRSTPLRPGMRVKIISD